MWTKLTNDDIYNQRQSVPAMVLMPEVQMKAEGHTHISQQGSERLPTMNGKCIVVCGIIILQPNTTYITYTH